MIVGIREWGPWCALEHVRDGVVKHLNVHLWIPPYLSDAFVEEDLLKLKTQLWHSIRTGVFEHVQEVDVQREVLADSYL